MAAKSDSTSQTELEREKERYAAFVRNSSEGIWCFELDKPLPLNLPTNDKIDWCFQHGYLAEANDAMAHMYGYKSGKKMLGARLTDLMPADDTQNIEYLRAFLDNGYRLNGVESHEIDKYGKDKYFRNSLVAVVEGDCVVRVWGTQQDVTELRKTDELTLANRQLKAQRKALVQLNKTKDDFIALASHQLRTPASAVKQYIGLLMENYAGPLSEDQMKYLQIAYDSNERQLHIINDLLKTAQIDSQQFELIKTRVNIGDLLKSAVSDLGATLGMHHSDIEWRHLDDVECSVDKNEIKLAFINLLDNACKYSYPGSKITVDVSARKNYVKISISDTGVGIDKGDYRRIFEKFTRVDNNLSDTVRGNGFGLYWVKRIINLHGGSISVTSMPKKGSTFTVRLPL